jgi:cellulose synthase/poly-beta-1,6-N-acetylglucosamine synthase-like glycosyltransferase
MLGGALEVGLVLLGTGPLLITAYLLFLTGAALFGRRQVGRTGQGVRRFAVLVPAHNEQVLIGRLLDNLRGLDYPVSNFEVWVVADNCDDATASIARKRGAHVLERFDSDDRAKGFALRWLLEQLGLRGQRFDAYVVLDADSVVSPNFLKSMDARLDAGSQVIQAYYSVLNAHESPLASLRYAALAAVHYVRPLGRAVVGLSTGLKGNGMCFSAGVLERFPWRWFTLAEDVEFHLALVRGGVRVDFAPEARVLADMPITLAQAGSQNARWERGRLALLKRAVPELLLLAARRRSLLIFDAGLEQIIPPQSVSLGWSALSFGLAVVLNVHTAAVVGGLSLLGQSIYLIAALLLVRAPLRAYSALVYAPVYLMWKVGIYVRALVVPESGRWVRTARTTPPGTV